METDPSGVVWVKIDRKRKVVVTSLLRAFGHGTDDELRALFPGEQYQFNLEATLQKDIAKNEADGVLEVYKRIRPGDLATTDNARTLIHSMFFRFDRYDFGRVGRYKLNQRFNFVLPNTKETRVLRPEDLISIIKEIMRLNVTQEEPDDIDHLGNRRIRAIGELIQNRPRSPL